MDQQEKVLVPKSDDLSLIHAVLYGGKCEMTRTCSFFFGLHIHLIVNIHTHTHLCTQPLLYLEYVKSFILSEN